MKYEIDRIAAFGFGEARPGVQVIAGVAMLYKGVFVQHEGKKVLIACVLDDELFDQMLRDANEAARAKVTP